MLLLLTVSAHSLVDLFNIERNLGYDESFVSSLRDLSIGCLDNPCAAPDESVSLMTSSCNSSRLTSRVISLEHEFLSAAGEKRRGTPI